MATVDVVYWNPSTPVIRGVLGKFLPKRPINNFGDLLGPVIVHRVLEDLGIDPGSGSDKRLLAVGSILRLAKQGDTIWGVGANGKSLGAPLEFTHLDVRAVRGPLTRQYLAEHNIDAPAIYGDPGLLIGHYWDRDELGKSYPKREHIVLPNFHDYSAAKPTANLVNPQNDLWSVIGQIAAADFVVGSSLHAIVIAESLGIPARLVASKVEPRFKFDDYYQGTGRDGAEIASSVAEALSLGGQSAAIWSPEALLASFPVDLWDQSTR